VLGDPLHYCASPVSEDDFIGSRSLIRYSLVETLVEQQNDRDLVALAREGDQAAFGWLMDRYQAMVKQIALKMVRNEYLAQELV